MTDGADDPQHGAFPAVVLDASFMAAYLLGAHSGENDSSEQGFAEARKTIRSVIEQNGQFFVPNLFYYEMGNILWHASRMRNGGDQSRISVVERQEIEYDLYEFPLSADPENDSALMMRVQSISAEYGLSFYDASYLELSRRLRLPLLTFDAALRRAAAL